MKVRLEPILVSSSPLETFWPGLRENLKLKSKLKCKSLLEGLEIAMAEEAKLQRSVEASMEVTLRVAKLHKMPTTATNVTRMKKRTSNGILRLSDQ